MQSNLFVGKNKDEALTKAKEYFNATEKELYYKVISKNDDKIELEVSPREEIIVFIKDYIRELLYKMNIDGNYEVTNLEKGCKITLYSNNDSILIGKNGKTIEAITILLRQVVETKFGFRFNILLDVSDYRRRKDKNIEQTALEVAREVFKTNIEARLEPMNSYQRRLIHNVLNDNKFVYTESYGEEPERCVIIKPKED